MTAPIKDTVKVDITNDTPRISQRGFGTGLILAELNFTEDRTKRYSEASELLDDGYPTSSEVYKKALAFMGQEKSTKEFVVGRRIPNSNAKQTVNFSVTPTGGTFTVTVGAATSAAINFDASASDIKTALELLGTVEEVTVTKTANDSFTIEFTGADANTAFDAVEISVASLTPATTAEVGIDQYGSAEEDILVAYAAIKEADNDFFGVIKTSDISDEDAFTLAPVIETEERIFAVLSADAAIASTSYDEAAPSDIAEKLKAASYTKTFAIFATSITDRHIDAAIMGLQLAKIPGSSTYMYKNLAGVTTDTLSSQQRSNLRSKNCNFYETQGGRAIFKDGKVPSGEFIDIIVGIDFLKVRMAETVYAGISTLEKLDFDAGGLDVVETWMLSALVTYGVNNNFLIADSIQIILPDIDDVPTADKANRTLKNVKFRALLKGAIHIIEISGSLSV